MTLKSNEMLQNSRTHLCGDELECVKEALSGGHWQGDGPFSVKCCEILSGMTGCSVFLTSSATSALELSCMSIALEPGSEVILPSYTFTSSANAIVRCGLKPVFVDVCEDTLNLDSSLIEQAVTPKTKAIMVVHYGGVAADMDAIGRVAQKYNLHVVEDAAQAVNASYKGSALGSIGDLGVYSFHQTKNFSCGEGGAIVVRNEEFLDAVEIGRQKGTNRYSFLRGEVSRYAWVGQGSNFMMSNILAAVLYPQLLEREQITAKRKALYERYMEELEPISDGRFRLPHIPSNCTSNYHLFYMLVENQATRDGILKHLNDHAIGADTHFRALHGTEGGKKYGVTRGPMDVSNQADACLLRLPLYADMTDSDQDRVLSCIQSYFREADDA